MFYKCTICLGKRRFKKKEWLEHLIKGEHPPRQREEFKRRCCEKGYMKRLLVVESNKPVANYQLLEHFWNSRNIVSEFVWWEDNPKLGCILFESEKNIAKILGGNDKKEISIGNEDQLLKVRRFASSECPGENEFDLKPIVEDVEVSAGSHAVFVDTHDIENVEDEFQVKSE